ncbi:MAG TPA: ankyrin repeat domain-containing protein [Chitinophagaceae bacterium]|nr:ankyrin repeat domain-containing protein [Chitinophagaceae bacterium]
MDYKKKLIDEIECHSVEGIKECFANGVNPNDHYNNAPLIDELTSEYGRTPRFRQCVKAFIDAGLKFNDDALLAVLADGANALGNLLKSQPDLKTKTYTLRCAYTPLHEATLLHICAEFNHVACAQVLVNHGAEVDAKAGIDEYGFGGQTPIFHTVNQNSDNSREMMEFLLLNSADIRTIIPGLIWGKGYPWETLIPAVNPISYAMMGLLPQMHRDENRISEIVTQLLKVAYGIEYLSSNIPNAYLK